MNEQIAKYYGVEPAAIVRYSLIDEGAVIRSLIDYGNQGIKVLYLDIAELEGSTSTTATFDLDYRELQALAKEQGIPANQSRDDLYAALFVADEEE